jgi:hypothetical protein
MKEIRRFKTTLVLVILLLILASICYFGGMYYITLKYEVNQKAFESQEHAYKQRLFELSRDLIANTNAVLGLWENISRINDEASEQGTDAPRQVAVFMEGAKEICDALKINGATIASEMRGLQKHPMRNQLWRLIQQLYVVYTKASALETAQLHSSANLSGQIVQMREEFLSLKEQVEASLPQLDDTADISGLALQGKAHAEAVVLCEGKRPYKHLCDHVLKKKMNFCDVERTVGVPKDKRKNAHAREVWIYPSDKAGFDYRVYFKSGEVCAWKLASSEEPLD